MTGSGECGNEPSDSIKCRKFLGLTSREGLCSVELVVVRLNTFHEIINSAQSTDLSELLSTTSTVPFSTCFRTPLPNSLFK